MVTGQKRWVPGLPSTVRGRGASRRGTVLMEYVLLGVLLLPVLTFGAKALFNPTPGVNPSGKLDQDFGLVGAAFLRWYWAIVDLVALPVP